MIGHKTINLFKPNNPKHQQLINNHSETLLIKGFHDIRFTKIKSTDIFGGSL